jgi:hypothetical protein
VPYAYTDAEIRTAGTRRGLARSSLACGILGLLLAIFGVWGATLSLVAVILASMARATHHKDGPLWIYGLVSGIAGLAIAIGWVVFITQALIPALSY